MARGLLAVVVAVTVAAGCGSGDPKARSDPTPATAGVGGAGRVVDIGGGRTLFVRCVGAGSPTVVLEAGFGADTHSWQDVHTQLGMTTRTCAYDRAGFGESILRPGVHDAGDDVEDLQRLLDGAHLRPPYVLVGQSYGGLLVRLFANAHPQKTAGVVLVDAKGRDQTRRELALWPRSQVPALRRTWAQSVRDGVNLASGDALGSRVLSLGHTPLAVITAGTHKADSKGMPPALARSLYGLWLTMQDELAALSSDHMHVVALDSDHYVQIARFYRENQQIDGQPGVVIRAVQEVVRAAREHAPLPPCKSVFSAADVQCRS
jgi:pimeloyl-ACP methyl ester carboxylesterase